MIKQYQIHSKQLLYFTVLYKNMTSFLQVVLCFSKRYFTFYNFINYFIFIWLLISIMLLKIIYNNDMKMLQIQTLIHCILIVYNILLLK